MASYSAMQPVLRCLANRRQAHGADPLAYQQSRGSNDPGSLQPNRVLETVGAGNPASPGRDPARNLHAGWARNEPPAVKARGWLRKAVRGRAQEFSTRW